MFKIARAISFGVILSFSFVLLRERSSAIGANWR
jgi:hypothetical protein